jgi:hypothetical protein
MTFDEIVELALRGGCGLGYEDVFRRNSYLDIRAASDVTDASISTDPLIAACADRHPWEQAPHAGRQSPGRNFGERSRSCQAHETAAGPPPMMTISTILGNVL